MPGTLLSKRVVTEKVFALNQFQARLEDLRVERSYEQIVL